ncbi:MAG TPA: hypothetical protein VGM43_22205 [Bryobacteraceae bacterium]
MTSLLPSDHLELWLPWFGVDTLSLAAGLAALILAVKRPRERLLLFLGIFATLYGLRLFQENELVRIVLGLGSSRQPILILTYLIPIPFALFFVGCHFTQIRQRSLWRDDQCPSTSR